MKASNRKDSYIVRFFTFLTHFIYHMVAHGFFGRIFTAYTAVNNAFRNSFFGTHAHATERGGGKLHRMLRRKIALAINHSYIARGTSRFLRLLCQCSLRTIGLFFVTTAFYSAVMYWLFAVIWHSQSVSPINLFAGIGALIIGIFLLFSDVSLGYALSHGFLFRYLIIAVFGVSEDSLKDMERVGLHGYAIAVPLGMVLGALSALVSPFYLIVGVVTFLYLVLVISVPEAGVMLLLLLLPFVGLLPNSELWLLLAVMLPLFSYVIKLLRGNRAFHMEVQDLPVLLMVLCFALSGYSVAGMAAWKGALLCAVFTASYFLIVNVMTTPHWLNRCRAVLIVSATAASLFGIVQFIVAAFTLGGGIAQLGAAVHAGFADRCTLAHFLVIAFPFAVSAFSGAERKYRLPTGFAIVTILSAAVLTWVQSAMLALAVMLIVYLLLYERSSFPFVLGGCALAPVVFTLLPDRVSGGFLTVLRADTGAALTRTEFATTLTGRIFFENGTGIFAKGAGALRLLFGLGNGGIEQFCSLYTSLSPDQVSASLNFWNYRLLEGGVLGVLLPALFFFLFYQNCFSLMKLRRQIGKHNMAIAGVAMTTGVLLFSLFRYAWYDYATLTAFFLSSALIVADARHQRERAASLKQETQMDGNAAELEYYGRAH